MIMMGRRGGGGHYDDSEDDDTDFRNSKGNAKYVLTQYFDIQLTSRLKSRCSLIVLFVLRDFSIRGQEIKWADKSCPILLRSRSEYIFVPYISWWVWDYSIQNFSIFGPLEFRAPSAVVLYRTTQVVKYALY